MFEIGKIGRLTLGYTNENKARVIDVDMTGWIENFPDGNIGLLVKRPLEDTFYPADIKRAGNVIIWVPGRADLEIDGEGEAQFVLTNEEGVELRCRVVKTRISASLGGTAGAKPDPADSFVQTVINAAATAEAAVEKMPSIGENGNWHAWDAAAGEYVDTGKPSKGKDGLDGDPGYTPQKGIDYFDGKDGQDGYTPVKGKDYHDGEDGISPTVKVQEISGGHRVTITDKDGAKAFDVLDGKDGEGGGGAGGADGGYYTPDVSSDGILNWTPSKSDMPAVPSADIKGPKGDAGYTPVKGKDYFDGKDGTSVTVKSVSTSSADGGSNVVTFSDGKTVTIKNGRKGSKGDTPVKGTDYWTTADRQSMVNDVIAALPVYNGEVSAV